MITQLDTTTLVPSRWNAVMQESSALLLTRKLALVPAADEDITPASTWTMPDLASAVEPHEGPLLVTIEYRIDPARTPEFLETMRESRQTWLRNGLLSWNLYSDLGEHGHFVEHLLDESWAAYVRRNERVSMSYVMLRERKMSFHVGPGAPVITRSIARSVAL